MKQQRITTFCLFVLLTPTLALAGAWTTPRGTLWAKASWFQQSTDEWYTDADQPILLPDNTLGSRAAGSRQPYRFNGSYESTAVFLEGYYGITDAIDVGLQVPWFDQSFDDDTRIDSPAESGFSDTRVFARWRLFDKPFLLTLKGGVKIPTGEFKNEDGLIPVGEGQWDYDIVVQAGRSLWPLPAYANVDVGYRVRTENTEILREPGDEWLVNAEVGYNPLPRLQLALKLDGLYGKAGRSFGLRTESLTKRITYLAPTASWRLGGDTIIEAALRISTGGRNFPAGNQIIFGLSTSVSASDAVPW
ncbi:MAG TPA: transporter [Candidatus Latescibacteria bacterium]|jgi:hypothetical protein|nr:transporter [Candidatus Latescibacterota bacterium]